MKKSKLIKSLVALAVSIVAAIGCISLVACGGDPEVNSVSLNKPTLSLAVGASETLTATTDPAGVTVTWTSSKTDVATVDANGKVTAVAAGTTVIKATAGSEQATCNVTVTAGGGAVTTYPVTRNFSYTGIVGKTLANDDNQSLAQTDFIGANDFITVTGDVRWRDTSKATGGAVELKKDCISVTFTGTGTLTVKFGSTSSTNTSGIAVKKADGTKLVATTVDTGVTRVEADDVIAEGYVNEAGFYYVTAGQKAAEAKILVFTIEEAGTYTLSGNWAYMDGTAKTRATRMFALTTVDNGPNA